MRIDRRQFFRDALSGALALAMGGRLTAAAAARLDRNNLLVYRDRSGDARPVRSTTDWLQRRAEIVRGMLEVMGPLPGSEKRCPLDLRVEEEVEAGTYVRRLVSYASEPESRTPAYLLIPKAALAGKIKARGILCLHPTDNKIGHKVVVGLGGRPNRQYAAELAERGFVALAPAYPLLANYQPDLEALGWQSGSLKAVWDNMRGLDLLESLPYIARRQFGAIGHSLGGHNAVFTAVHEARIHVVVSSCGLDSFLDYMSGDPAVWRPEKGWCQMRYMQRLAGYAGRLEEIPFDFHELVAAIAPRVCFISAPVRDSNFKWESVDRIAHAASRIYTLYGKPQTLIIDHPDADHDFPDAMRAKAYELFRKHLN